MVPENRTKEVWIVSVVSILTVCTVLLVGTLARNLITVDGVAAILVSIVAFIWAAAVAWAYMVLHEWPTGRHIITGVAVAVSLLMGFLSIAAIAGSALMGLFLTAAARTISSATRERITFRLSHTLFPGIKYIVASIAVFLVVMLLPTVQRYAVNGGAQIPAEATDVLLRPATPIIRNMLPGYTPTSTVDELIAIQLQREAGELPAGSAGQVSAQSQVRSEISREFGIAVNGDDTVADVVTRYVNNKIRQAVGGDGIVVVIILAVVGLLAIRALVPLLSGIVFLLAAGIYKITKRAGVTTIIQSQVPVERLKI